MRLPVISTRPFEALISIWISMAVTPLFCSTILHNINSTSHYIIINYAICAFLSMVSCLLIVSLCIKFNLSSLKTMINLSFVVFSILVTLISVNLFGTIHTHIPLISELYLVFSISYLTFSSSFVFFFCLRNRI